MFKDALRAYKLQALFTEKFNKFSSMKTAFKRAAAAVLRGWLHSLHHLLHHLELLSEIVILKVNIIQAKL